MAAPVPENWSETPPLSTNPPIETLPDMSSAPVIAVGLIVTVPCWRVSDAPRNDSFPVAPKERFEPFLAAVNVAFVIEKPRIESEVDGERQVAVAVGVEVAGDREAVRDAGNIERAVHRDVRVRCREGDRQVPFNFALPRSKPVVATPVRARLPEIVVGVIVSVPCWTVSDVPRNDSFSGRAEGEVRAVLGGGEGGVRDREAADRERGDGERQVAVAVGIEVTGDREAVRDAGNVEASVHRHPPAAAIEVSCSAPLS